MSVAIQLQPNLPQLLPVESVIKQWRIPASIWTPVSHPRTNEVIAEVDGYFMQHWGFTSDKAKKTFVDAGFSRVTSLYFPESTNDRIHFACRLLTVLFLIDDLLEDMSFEDGEQYNENLISISRGNTLPDRMCFLCPTW